MPTILNDCDEMLSNTQETTAAINMDNLMSPVRTVSSMATRLSPYAPGSSNLSGNKGNLCSRNPLKNVPKSTAHCA